LRNVTTVANATEGSNATSINATTTNATANNQTNATNITTANSSSSSNQTTIVNNTSPATSNAAMSVSIVPNAATLGEKAFSPNPTNVKAGGTVTWTNDDTVLHTIKSGAGPSDPKAGSAFDSGFEALQKKGSTFSHTFSAPGTFPYFCEVHPTMVGKVTVS
jgi:plastocyanin